MKLASLLLICGSLVFLGGCARKHDVTFESSDGNWTDSTAEAKGRDFKLVLRTFETYRFKQNKPDVTLVRVTALPEDSLFWSSEDKKNPKWKVPYGKPSGRAKHGGPSWDTPEERAAISRKADEAYAFWIKK